MKFLVIFVRTNCRSCVRCALLVRFSTDPFETEQSDFFEFFFNSSEERV